MFYLFNEDSEIHTNVKINNSEQNEVDANDLKELVQNQAFEGFNNWTLVLRGLVHPDNLTQKRSLYILKRIVDKIEDTEINDFFQRFFLVLETVDEKQVHIVKQVFGHISSLWSVQAGLPWNLVIFRRLFKHQNQSLAKVCLQHFLTQFVIQDVQDYLTKPCFQDFFETSILVAFNNPKWHDTPELYEAFKEFMRFHPGSLWTTCMKSVLNQSWAPIPLFHCLRAIQEATEKCDKIDNLDLEQIKDFVSWSMKCQEPLIRGAAQECLLKIIMNLTRPTSENVQELFKTFSINIRGTKIYQDTCHWLKDIIETIDIKDPKLFVIKCDIQGLSPIQILEQDWIRTKISNIKENAFRLYGSVDILDELVKVGGVLRLLSKPEYRQGRDHLAHKDIAHDTIDKYDIEPHNDLVDIVIQSLNKIQIEQTDDLIKILEIFIEQEIIQDKVQDLFKHLSHLTIQELKFVVHLKDFLNKDVINEVIDKKHFPKLSAKYHGSEASLHLSLQWHLVTDHPGLLALALEHIQIGGSKSVCTIIEAISRIAAQVDPGSLATFVLLAKSAVFDLRKNDQFWPAYGALVKVSFCPQLSDEYLIQNLEEVLVQAEQIHGLALVMMNQVEQNFDKYSKSFKVNVISKCVIYGPIYKKDQIMLNTVNEFIFDHHFAINCLEGSDHLVDVQVRVKALHLLLEFHPEDIQTLVHTLVTNEIQMTSGKKRYFENSAIHIVKQRTAQALLLCSRMIKKDDQKDIIEMCVDNIEAPSQQLSVRYLYEWILMRLDPTLVLPRIKDQLAQAKKSRLGIVPAYLMILTNVQGQVPEEILEILAPWCLGQQFMTRLCANACFKKVYVQADQDVQDKYSILFKCIQETLEHGDKVKNIEKANADFYLTHFDSKLNFNLSDIFNHFNRLMKVNDIIKDSMWTKNELKIDIINPQSDLKNCIVKSSDCSSMSLDMSILNIDPGEGQVQKKITPWNQMFDLEQESKKDPTFPDLIVIASMIDRAPNLGGLSRTCEIFGAGKLVINNKKILEDKEFLNTSVTAHQWIDIEEVKVDQLMEYLSVLKSQGYQIIGIEQTSESEKLQDFKFPSKSVILLGNEKEGLPVEFIKLLDKCLEIPQSGLIRSLNVHVTGAIVIWEYVRQNLK